MKNSCPYCGKEIEYEKIQKFNSHKQFCIKNPDHDEMIKKMSKLKGKTIVPRIKYKLNCLNCNSEFFIETTESLFKKEKYQKCCCKKCAHSYSSKHNDYNLTKNSFCKECGTNIVVKNNSSSNVLCNKCKEEKKIKIKEKKIKEKKIKEKKIKEKKIKICKQCGQEKCLKPEICRKYRIFKTLVKYFGFNNKTIGTIKLYEEYEKIKMNLFNDYYENLLSISDIMTKYNYDSKNDRNFSKIMKSLDINRRTFSESTKNSYLVGKLHPLTHLSYKCGWHETWDNKKVYYRSSYELNYCKILDEQKIVYEMEKIRLVYWDTQKLSYRITIPDFYLPKNNTIVEIKSDYTYDEQNMKDKIQSYTQHGYSYKIILEGKEI